MASNLLFSLLQYNWAPIFNPWMQFLHSLIRVFFLPQVPKELVELAGYGSASDPATVQLTKCHQVGTENQKTIKTKST